MKWGIRVKIKDLKTLSDEDLGNELEKSREELFNLRFQRSINQLKNPMRIRFLKKTIARILTLLRARKED